MNIIEHGVQLFNNWRKEKETEWEVSISKKEELYLKGMRGMRKMEYGCLVDPVWYQAVMKKQREKERPEKNQEEKAVLKGVQ